MRIIETQVMKYSELSPAAQEKAREWFIEGDSDDDWADCIIEDAKAAAAVMGWTIQRIYWSGFCSQGDGACFTGTWYVDDVQPVEKLEILDDELIRIATEMQSFVVTKKMGAAWFDCVSAEHTGRNYYHDGMIALDFQLGAGDVPRDEEDRFKELSRDFMRWVYKALEAEYEYRRSEEFVRDAIEANEYEFTEEGEIA